MSASQTLLLMTQEILESMESDSVTAITDTAESTAVAHIIRRTYWDLFGVLDLPEHYSLFKLDQTSIATPNLMTVPPDVMSIKWIRYNNEFAGDTTDSWQLMQEVPSDDFLARAFMLNESATNVGSYSYTFNPTEADTVKMFYLDDAPPTYFATPDDFNILFNAVNTEVEDFLHAANTIAWGLVDPIVTFSDSFTFDLDNRQQALLFNESKAMCFAELKQTQHAKAEARSRRLMISSQKNKARVLTGGRGSLYSQLPGYGRK